jgi:response regulator RpfG family c-di-GMP phosphodiesterase
MPVTQMKLADGSHPAAPGRAGWAGADDFTLGPADTFRARLDQLVELSVVLPDEWDELPPAARDEILRPAGAGDLLDRLVRHRLLTEYQAETVRQRRAGELVLGHYRLLEPVGKGGMGVVFRGEHLHLRRPVAVKVMTRTLETDARLLPRFYAEARAVAKLQHPNIVGCSDAGRHARPDGPARDYYVMELIAGQDLHAIVTRSGPLPLHRACELFRQIAEALAATHRLGLVHRDIKPGNILVTPDWQAKLLDFGLVLQQDRRVTEPGVVLGTIGYMAPEQARDSQVDGRADLFSLGATLFWALTGRDPYPNTGNLVHDLTTRLVAPALDVRRVRPELPAEVGALIAKLTEPEPDKRYQSARAAAAALTGFGRWVALTDVTAVQKEKPRVLVVEDDPLLRKLVTGLLRDCTCVEVGDGAAAWGELEKTPFDLVVLDVNIPGLSGPELLAKVQADAELRGRLRILVMSGDMTSEAFGGLLVSGADDYLAKPFNPPEFLTRTRALLGRPVTATPPPRGGPAPRPEPSGPAPMGNEVVPAVPLALAVSRVLEELGLATGGYAQRIGRYVRALAAAAPDRGEYARLKDGAFVDLLARVAPAHDTGVLTIPSTLLMKPDRLDADEFAMVQQHTTLGAEIIRDVAGQLSGQSPDLDLAGEIARHHHERWDGGGYPDGLAGEQIPLAARVVAVASVYEALRSRRPHRPAYNRGRVVRLMVEESVGQFDPTLAAALGAAASGFDEIFQSGKR